MAKHSPFSNQGHLSNVLVNKGLWCFNLKQRNTWACVETMKIYLFLCSTQREIPHLHKPWYYSLFNLFGCKHEHKFENNIEIVLLVFLRYVVEPYRKYPNLLEVLLNFLKTEQAIGIRREVCL